VRISLLVAADELDTIGRDGALPWYLPDDLKRFKRFTTGHVVVAGRLTQDSIVARLGGPLPGRTTVVVTRQAGLVEDDHVRYANDVPAALALARELEAAAGGDEVFVIGGARIYGQVLPQAETVYLTRVHREVEGDTHLPAGWLAAFDRVAAEDHGEYSFETYQRRTLYYEGNYRTVEQLEDMRRLEAEGVCVFCPEHRDQVDVLHREPQWTVVPNKFPYRGTRLHLLLVPDEHVADLADLSTPAQASFWPTLQWVREHYGLMHYGIAVRNGDPRYSGGTIRHLHVHLLQGDVDNPQHDPVRVKLSSRPAE
jgi:dihydrofolate reductase/diadenosine tetraphosphate (Ap4A) HIT family hydrolase